MVTDNQRLLQYGLYGLGIVMWFVTWRMFSGVIDLTSQIMSWRPGDIPIAGSLSNLSALVSLIVTAAAVEYTRRHEVANRFGVEVVAELRKVSWPNWKEVQGTTMVVVGVSFVVAVILWVFDMIYDRLITLLFSLA